MDTLRHLSGEARLSVQDRVRDGIKALLEQIMEEELSAQLHARHRERTDSRAGERNGHYTRGLATEVGPIEQLRVPRAREGPLLTEVFERYRRMTGSLEEAVLEMYLQASHHPTAVGWRKIEKITGKLSGVRVSKDATSRITQRLDESRNQWRSRRLERSYPYVYLDATYLNAALREVSPGHILRVRA